jgi:hypothetical protein
MQVLLDEWVAHRLRLQIVDHEVTTIQYRGWGGLRNGELLRRMQEAGIDVLMTRDGNLRFQQNVAQAGIAVVVLKAPSNDLSDLQPLMPLLLQTLQFIRPGQVVEVGAS